MKFGVREICDVVFKAKSNNTKVGNLTFQKDEPVLYFDTLKTSSLEGAATTVYAEGGAGNSRLIAWEGERTLTFTMEDALLSPLGFSILSGAGLIEANSEDAHIHVHQTLQTYGTVMGTTGGTATGISVDASSILGDDVVCTGYDTAIYGMILNSVGDPLVRLGTGGYSVTTDDTETVKTFYFGKDNIPSTYTGGDQVLVLVDYYIVKTSGAYQIDIEPSKFGGNYYIEASTLFKRQADGRDMPAEFVIPNAKVQSNFTFSLASTGDPSTFTFTLDAFPDYTKWNKSKKVLAAIQIIDEDVANEELADVHQDNGGLPESGTTSLPTVYTPTTNAADIADV